MTGTGSAGGAVGGDASAGVLEAGTPARSRETRAPAKPSALLDIPSWTETPDYFVWDAFDRASRDPRRTLGTDALQQEALLGETDNLYVIPDQFGVVSGHVLVLPKASSSSIAELDPSMDDEVAWTLRRVEALVAAVYDARTLVAEHGECGCATTDQAHIHVVPVPRTVTPTRLRTAIDVVLRRRLIGIERVVYRGTEFTAPEDLQWLIGVDGAQVTGRQLRCADFAVGGTYPAAARRESRLTGEYVYFSGPGVRFVSTRGFRSQFVREVVSVLSSHPAGAWDRRVHTSRDNMFDTFDRLAGAFWRSGRARHGFAPRAGRP